LGEARIADDLFEARAVELTGWRFERGIVHDLARDLSVRHVEAKLACALVERSFGHELAGELLVKSQEPRLVRRDRAAKLAAQLLDAVVIDLAELLGGDFGRADLGDRRAAEAAEDVADAPDREADRDHAENDRHHDPPEPVGGGLTHTAKHESPLIHKGMPASDPLVPARARIIGMAALHRNLSLLAA